MDDAFTRRRDRFVAERVDDARVTRVRKPAPLADAVTNGTVDRFVVERMAERLHTLAKRTGALDGVRPEDLNIARLIDRVAGGGIDEVVLAMNATLEGQTTAHYLAERLEGYPVRITQLAHGLPVGGELDYLDEGTLAQALRARRPIG